MTDQDLKQAAMRELERDPSIDATAIGVSAHLGVVTLSGVVECWTEKHRVDAAVHQVAGLLDVANEIAIRPGAHLASANEEIAHCIRGLLQREFPVVADQVKCTVQAGDIVTLMGTVATTEQRSAIVRAIQRLHGVQGVNIELVTSTVSC